MSAELVSASVGVVGLEVGGRSVTPSGAWFAGSLGPKVPESVGN